MFRFPPLTPFVKKLLITLFALYLAQVLLGVWGSVPLTTWLALRPGSVDPFALLGIFTHIFAIQPGGGSVITVAIAIVFLWWMLCPFELQYGAKRTLQLCVAATLGASVPTYLLGFVLPEPKPLLGSSPLWLAAIAAFAWGLRGGGKLNLFGAFQMKAEHVILLVLGFSVLGFLNHQSWTNLTGDFGAVAAGMAFVEWMRRPPSGKRKRRKSDFRVVSGSRDKPDTWLN